MSGTTTNDNSKEATAGFDDEEIPSDFSDNDESPDEHNSTTPITREQVPFAPPRGTTKRRKTRSEWDRSSHELYIQKTHQQFTSYRNDTINKWNEKLKLASGKMTSKVVPRSCNS